MDIKKIKENAKIAMASSAVGDNPFLNYNHGFIEINEPTDLNETIKNAPVIASTILGLLSVVFVARNVKKFVNGEKSIFDGLNIDSESRRKYLQMIHKQRLKRINMYAMNKRKKGSIRSKRIYTYEQIKTVRVGD